MTTSEALKIIYDTTVKAVGKDKAPSYVSTTLSSILFDLNQSGPISSDKIEEAIQEEAKLCLNCLKKAA